uniref:Putative secreted protein n=1 Tax=Ixodes ricinus TaxID=34613 RepID=A0A6B0U7B0_IXORI
MTLKILIKSFFFFFFFLLAHIASEKCASPPVNSFAISPTAPRKHTARKRRPVRRSPETTRLDLKVLPRFKEQSPGGTDSTAGHPERCSHS